MASTVTTISSTINVNFPKFGESLSNVGEFQANFKKIYNSFGILGKEVNNYLNDAIKKDDANDFGGNVIKSAVLQNHSYRVNDLGSVDNGLVTINYREGAYHKCNINSGYYTFNFVNWSQQNTLSKIRLQIYNQSTATTSTSFIGFSGKVRYYGTLTSQVSLTGNSSIFYDVWTVDSGNTISIKPLGSLSTIEPTYYSGGGGSGGGGGGPLPTITSVIPGLFGSIGYEGITIIGTNFVAGTYVKVNNIAITTSTGSPTQITFTSAPNIPGTPVSVEVITSNGSTSTVVYYYDNSGGGGGDGGGTE